MTSKITKRTTTRRQILAAVPVALAAGAIPVAKADARESVTPALARLLEQWQAACAECRRLSAIDDEAAHLYYGTAPAIPHAIVAQRNHLGRFDESVFHHVYYLDRLDDGPSEVLKSSYWMELGDRERATIAETFIAADEAAYETSGYNRTIAALDDHHRAMDDLEVEIRDFEPQSLADVIALARVAKSLTEDGREHIRAEFYGSIIQHLVVFADKPTVTHVF